MKTTSDVITSRNQIARLALDGDRRYTHEAIGADNGDVNEMTDLIGLPLVYAARATDDVAVYSNGDFWVYVVDANGPVAIKEVAS